MVNMSQERHDTETIPIVEEELFIEKRVVETGRVRVRTEIEERQQRVRDQVMRSRVNIERVPVNKEVDAIPEPRTEGNVLIIPVVEEIVYVRKALVVTEEVRITKETEVEEWDKPITLRREVPVIEREELSGEQST